MRFPCSICFRLEASEALLSWVAHSSVGEFSRPESEGSANEESGGCSSFNFSAANEHDDLRRVAANVAFELIRAAEPSRPILEELRSRGNEKCYHQRQLCCIPDTDSETDDFEGNRIEVEFELKVLRTMASYAAADCHFCQDAHRRMA